ncbi:MAG: glycerol-3-phosphate acyltransferase [Candidatus Omnitrophica bacterium]|nr:glycerol-3-phosphate acyltransferase [Candidatus Omnitrophota bacterium]
MDIIIDIAFIIFSYLLGSIPTGVIISKYFFNVDIQKVGSGNIGATNVARTLGKKVGILTLIGDALKGIIPIIIVRLYEPYPLNQTLIFFCSLAAFFGHLFPIYLKFKGGKGAATSGGVLLFLMPILFPLVIALWFVAQKTNPRSPKILLACILVYFICMFFAYGLRVGMMIFLQTSISTILLIITGMLVNPDVIKEIREKR